MLPDGRLGPRQAFSFIVSSATRKDRAISAVVGPHTTRKERATRASMVSAGWQQVKMSRSWSSWRTSPSHASGTV